jgi:FMN phosphatase YigB (HAD superfamily)
MIVGFDFDKVFIDYPPLVPYSLIDLLYKGRSYFLKNLGKNPVMHYRFPGELEQKVRVISHHHLLRPPIKVNIEALKKISSDKKNKTYLVSSRFGFLKGRTEAILKRYKLKDYFNGVYFNYKNEQPHIFKERIIKKLNIDTYIDDDLHVALYLSKRIPKLTIYWVDDGRIKPESLPKNVISIPNLSFLDKKFLKK